MNYERINWRNGAETPLNKINLNKMDEAIYYLFNEFANLRRLEFLGAFPNQSNSCISNCVNFRSTNGFALTYGTLDVSGGKLIVSNPDYASTQLTAKLKKNIVINNDRNILVKLRVKAVTGSNVVIYPEIGLSDGTSVFVTLDSIIGSNLTTNTTYPKYTLPNNKWVDIWYIFGANVDTEIESIDLHIAPYATIEVSSIQAFYSIDKNGGVGTFIDSGIVTTTSSYSAMAINSNLEITEATYEKGEI